jgi:hypothetical protein
MGSIFHRLSWLTAKKNPLPHSNVAKLAERIFLFRDAFCVLVFALIRIHLRVILHVFWHIVFMKNGFDGTFRNTGFTVDAFVGMNIDHLVFTDFIKTFDWANDNAISVATAITRFGNNVSHDVFLSIPNSKAPKLKN